MFQSMHTFQIYCEHVWKVILGIWTNFELSSEIVKLFCSLCEEFATSFLQVFEIQSRFFYSVSFFLTFILMFLVIKSWMCLSFIAHWIHKTTMSVHYWQGFYCVDFNIVIHFWRTLNARVRLTSCYSVQVFLHILLMSASIHLKSMEHLIKSFPTIDVIYNIHIVLQWKWTQTIWLLLSLYFRYYDSFILGTISSIYILYNVSLTWFQLCNFSNKLK